MVIDKSLISFYKDQMIIYRIFNAIDNKSYIGKSSKGMNRILDHIKSHKCDYNEYRARLLYRAMKKHSINNFQWEILEICFNEQHLNIQEKFYIQKYNSLNRDFGYNLSEGGTGGNNWLYLDEEDKLIAKEKLSKSGIENYKNNPERKKESSIRLAAIRKDPNKSRKNAEVTSARLKLLNKTDSRFITAKCKKVFCVENGKIYASYKEAASDLNISYPTIARSVRTGTKGKIKGYTFKKI